MTLRLNRNRFSGESIELHSTEQRGASTLSTTVPVNNAFSVDVGSGTPFKVRIRKAVKFSLMSDDDNKVCLKVHYASEGTDVLMLKWSTVQRECNERDHITSRIGATAATVPKYKSKEVYNHNGVFVCVTLRSYIPGTSMNRVLSSLSENDIDAIQMQVEAIIWQLTEKTSESFGHIQYATLRTANATSYIRVRSFFDKLTAKIDRAEWSEIGADSYVGAAVFCHGALSPDHIILNGSTVVGIIGWSNADFKPEVYDRLTYYFASTPTDPLCWHRRMANVPSSPATPPPSVEFVINTTEYVYRSTWANASLSRRHVLDKLFTAVRTNYTLVTCLSTAVEMECDNMSLSSLSNWTDSTWDRSVATEATAVETNKASTSVERSR